MDLWMKTCNAMSYISVVSVNIYLNFVCFISLIKKLPDKVPCVINVAISTLNNCSKYNLWISFVVVSCVSVYLVLFKLKQNFQSGHMIICLLTELCQAGLGNIWLSVMKHWLSTAWFICRNLKPNIFQPSHSVNKYIFCKDKAQVCIFISKNPCLSAQWLSL